MVPECIPDHHGVLLKARGMGGLIQMDPEGIESKQESNRRNVSPSVSRGDMQNL